MKVKSPDHIQATRSESL